MAERPEPVDWERVRDDLVEAAHRLTRAAERLSEAVERFGDSARTPVDRCGVPIGPSMLPCNMGAGHSGGHSTMMRCARTDENERRCLRIDEHPSSHQFEPRRPDSAP